MGENKAYLIRAEENGSVNISEDVVAAIAVSAVKDVEGVSGMASNLGANVTELVSKKNVIKGVKLDMGAENIVVDLYIIVRYGFEIMDVAEKVQVGVKNSLEALTGIEVGAVNVHVGGISFE
ncbi:MAG: Asp23/Gls24 family envelope stress response protein [Oscillospiraceae bacterium]|nr:Asp23/Gls24 family envelope stress response protein [Oscillospiraceae bacterium]